jgi:NADPH2:quinone reductase
VRALVNRQHPVRWVLTELPQPDVGPAEVLIEVNAAGLNRADLLMRHGGYTPTAADWAVAPDRVGFEMAGTIRAAGSEVKGFSPGDRVLAQTGGACAEFVAVDHRLVLPAPHCMSWPAAAGLPSALLTEFDALITLAGIQPGERVLVAGAASGVGLVGIQLARAFGASAVVATTRSGTKEQLLRSLGATHVIDSSIAPPPDLPPVDILLDHVGGSALSRLLPLAAKRARIVQIGRLAGQHTMLDLELLAARRLQLIGTTFRGRTATELYGLVARVRDELPTLTRSWEVHAHIDSTFALAEAEHAAARLASGQVVGKVVLTID